MTDPARPPTEESPSESALRGATLEGVRWITYGRVCTEIVAFATLAVLAHLIPPSEYGRVAIALIIQGLAIGLTNEGFGNPLVQRKEITRAHLESGALMSLGFGITLAALVYFLCPFVTDPLYDARTTHLVQMSCVLFPIYGLVVVPLAVAQRRLDLRLVSIIETAALMTGSLASVVLAVAGLDGEAVVLGVIATAALTALLLQVVTPLPRPRWHRSEARDILRFGLPASFASLTYFGVRNVDYVLIGARLGIRPLGLYYRAFALGVSNQLKIGAILMRVSFPVYSRTESEEQMRSYRDRMTQLNACVVVPLLILLAITAPDVVPWLFGSRWDAAVVPTQILAFAGIATSLTHATTPFLFATGRPGAVLALNAATLVVYAGGILVTIPLGLNAVCIAVVVANVLMTITAYGIVARLTHLPMRRVWDDVAPAAIASVPLAVIAVPLMNVLSPGAPNGLTAVVVSLAGGAAYLLALRFVAPARFADLGLILGRIIPRRRRRRAIPEPDGLAAAAKTM